MKNSILDKNHDRCTSCGICEAICPKNAIKIELTKEGFYYPKINEIDCISCGICKKTCIKFQEIEREDSSLLVYSAKNRNNKILEESSSGGVSYELMKECIKQGYKVVGVAYDYKEDIAITKICNTNIGLYEFFGSKYMQSYTVKALKEIMKNTDDNYAIFGTPCQIYSLAKFAELKKIKDNFIFVDLFCHGCPSLNLWKKYLEKHKKICNVEKFEKIGFRSKCYGWHEMSYSFKVNEKIYLSSLIKDPFYEIFLDKNIFNKACYGCKIRSNLYYCDIRLGDFWGKRYDDDIEGVSAVVIASNKGKVFFDLIKDKFKVNKHELDEVLISQSCSKEHTENKELREKVIKLCQSNLTIEEIIKEYRKSYSIKKKIKKQIIFILKKILSQNNRNKLKKFLHK